MDMNARIVTLKCASSAVIAAGVLVGLASMPATALPVAFLLDAIFWPVDGLEGVTTPEARLLSAIGGGILIGWGVLLWQLTTRLLPREPALARRLILCSVGIWFVADSAGSLAAGAPLNVVGNVAFLAAFWIPLRRGAAFSSPAT